MPPSGTVVPASATLCRLLQIVAPAPRLGDEVGADPDEVETTAESSNPPDTASLPTAVEGAAPSRLDAWVAALADERRVLCAHAVRPSVRTLNQRFAGSHPAWWLAALVHTQFSRRDSHLAHTAGARVWTYRRGGAPQCGFDWFPAGAHFGMPRGRIDALLHYGLLVTVTELRRGECAASTSARSDTREACASLLLHAEAASAGVAPALFAGFLLHEGGASSQPNSDAWNDAARGSGGHSPHSPPSPASARRVAAHVAVSQVHTFTLTDMLTDYLALGDEANTRAARQQVHLALGALRTQLDRATKAGLFKLNVGPDDVVFCPELTEASTDEWELRGFGLRSEHASRVPGTPFLAHYSTSACTRWRDATGASEKLMYLFMLTLAAAAVCARFGDAAAECVEALFLSQSTQAALFAPIAAAHDRGTAGVRAVLALMRLPTDLVNEAARDWHALVGDAALNRATLLARLANRDAPMFARLVGGRAAPRATRAARAARVSVAAALASRQRARTRDAVLVKECAA